MLAVLNEKGGVGKTTIATHLARGLPLAGHDGVLVDSAPLGSARDGYAAGKDNPLPPVIGLGGPALFKELPVITGGFPWVVSDGSPSVEALAVVAIKAADRGLIPVPPSPYDLGAAESRVELVKAPQETTNGRLKAAFAVSRQLVGTRLIGEAREAREGYGLPMLTSFTSQRGVYANSATSGGATVLDTEPDGTAAQEIGALTAEVLAWR